MRKLLLFGVGMALSLSVYCQLSPEASSGNDGDLFMQKQPPAGMKGFVIKGEIANAKDGAKVFLLDDISWPVRRGDSTVIKNGKFVLSGYVKVPVLVKVVIDPTPEAELENALATALYLENSEISYTGDMKTLQTYYYDPDAKGKVPAEVKGSKEDVYYREFSKMLEPLEEQANAVRGKYFALSMNDNVTPEDEIPLIKEIDEIERAIVAMRLKWIKSNPATAVAVEQCMWLFRNALYIDFTAAQIDQVLSIMRKANPEREADYKMMETRAKRTAYGEKYSDMVLTTPEGKTVKLSGIIPQGKYVLLDFWFSGCAPCEGEIPHLKEVYEHYKNKDFTIVSISADVEQSTWLETLQKHAMPWTQLRDQTSKGIVDAKVCTDFNVVGFPTLLLLDKEGRFMKTDMRGVKLNMALEELLGKPTK